MILKTLKAMIRHPIWAKRVKKLPIITNPKTGEQIVLATITMEHITQKEALKLKRYLEKGSGKKLTLLSFDHYGEEKLYIKNDEGVNLRFRIE